MLQTKNRIQNIVKRFGYEIRKIKSGVQDNNGVEIYEYLKTDGSFDYEKYKQIQIDGNKNKLDYIWVLEDNISFLSDYIRKIVGSVQFGICHGTRRGKEQEWFRKYLDCDVIGTEISNTATEFPHTIQWDFHEVKPEWKDSVDFIYSNSFDHAYDPEKCINAWMSCVKKNGICILEHTSGHEKASELDPFGAHIVQMPYLILTWGQGKFFVREILDAPVKLEALTYTKFLIIQRT